MKRKTSHYRNVFKSDHLSSADLEDLIEAGQELIFTISHVKQEYGARVAGRKIDANIAYFKEDIKPLVLNATNCDILRSFVTSNQVDDWIDIKVELYVQKGINFGGERVNGVRIKPNQPGVKKPKAKLGLNDELFNKLLLALSEDRVTIEVARESYRFTEQQELVLSNLDKAKV